MGLSKYNLDFKGKGVAYFKPWHKREHPDLVMLEMIRGTMHGSRQCAMAECFVDYYLMRPVWFEYLTSDMNNATGILERTLVGQLSCLEFIGAVRARCIHRPATPPLRPVYPAVSRAKSRAKLY